MSAAPQPAGSARALEVRLSGPADDAARDALVRTSADGTFFHLARWRDFVHDLYGHQPYELGAWEGDQLVGHLPLIECVGLTGKRVLMSIPYSVYGGPVARDREVRDALLAEARLMAERHATAYLELRFERDPEVDDLVGTDLYCTFKRELPDDPAEVLQRMPKKARAEARKARTKHGLELTEGGWYVDDLARLFLQNKHSLGSPSLPPEHFYRLMERMQGDVYVHLVRRQREPLAAVMSFGFGDTLIAYYAGTAPDADRSHSASNFMYMALQEWAVERGFREFDFCRSRRDSGPYHFKVHQGFEPTPLNYRYHLVRASGPPSFNPSNPKTVILQRTWSRLPLWLARALSRRMARRLG